MARKDQNEKWPQLKSSYYPDSQACRFHNAPQFATLRGQVELPKNEGEGVG